MSHGLSTLILGLASYGLIRGTNWNRLLLSKSARTITHTATSTPVSTCPVMGSKSLSTSYLQDLSIRVLTFWFGDVLTSTSPAPSQELQMKWFRADPTFDEQIRKEFGSDVERALTGHYTAAMTSASPHTRLALVIMLDQFTRNLYRGRPKMYSGDEQALRICMTAFETYQDDRVLHPIEILFLALPLEHHESIDTQNRYIKECQKLEARTDLPPGCNFTITAGIKYGLEHQQVIAQFGRYPSRNAILGRQSTPAELEFLKTHKGW